MYDTILFEKTMSSQYVVRRALQSCICICKFNRAACRSLVRFARIVGFSECTHELAWFSVRGLALVFSMSELFLSRPPPNNYHHGYRFLKCERPLRLEVGVVPVEEELG